MHGVRSGCSTAVAAGGTEEQDILGPGSAVGRHWSVERPDQGPLHSWPAGAGAELDLLASGAGWRAALEDSGLRRSV